VAALELSLQEDLPQVLGHAGDLGQAMLNLIVNASHAVTEQHKREKLGLIKISTSALGGHVLIRVEDDGCGIPTENLKKVFDPFFTTKGVGLGTGQGLALVHRAVVEMMNGEVEVHSERGKGTRFTLRLPAVKQGALH